MKISNETKVGALTSIIIVLLILGFNFLKGKSLFKTGEFLYADFDETKGIMISNPVFVNGFQVGSVYEINNTDLTLKKIRVGIKLKQEYQIPTNSLAYIDANPLGTNSLVIQLGNSKDFLPNNASLNTFQNPGLLGELKNTLTPVTTQINTTVKTLDSVLKNMNSIFDLNTKNNLQTVVANINLMTAKLLASSTSLQQMMTEQTGSIAKSMDNVNSFTQNLSSNNEKITSTINNLEKTTHNLSEADISGSVTQLKTSIEKLNGILHKLDSKEGSLGLLMNDKTLYNNLTNTVRSANILLDDLKTHPKRYVNISVFGKKDKSTPLTAPLNDSIK
ncbi:MAG: MlaD family protein [Chitinophagaceae bacterium]|jgi:phospholipid/cholesterol/gamma-HCH transport system substrate-binding protein|nr:MCE family protein [Chitinophagaceae bacterium]MBP9739617.1 MCE family protein [Chitinophagaceae bacterium]